MNVHIDTLVVDSALPLTPQAVHAALSREAPALTDQPITQIAAVIAESVAASRAD